MIKLQYWRDQQTIWKHETALDNKSNHSSTLWSKNNIKTVLATSINDVWRVNKTNYIKLNYH
jgi:hypothetical protein